MELVLTHKNYLGEILLLLEWNELYRLSIVCKSWHQFLDNNNNFWKRKVLLIYPSLQLLPLMDDFDWKKWLFRKQSGLRYSKNIEIVYFFQIYLTFKSH